MRNVLEFTLRHWKLVIICLIMVIIGASVTYLILNMQSYVIEPDYQPEPVNWLIATPILLVEAMFPVIGFIAGRICDKDANKWIV